MWIDISPTFSFFFLKKNYHNSTIVLKNNNCIWISLNLGFGGGPLYEVFLKFHLSTFSFNSPSSFLINSCFLCPFLFHHVRAAIIMVDRVLCSTSPISKDYLSIRLFFKKFHNRVRALLRPIQECGRHLYNHSESEYFCTQKSWLL
jgi:hypothetical protein